MKESDFWKLVKSNLPPRCHSTRIENVASSGIPDLDLFYLGKEAWLELKLAHRGKVSFRNAQRNWHLDRREAGGNSLILIRIIDQVQLYNATAVLSCPYSPNGKGNGFIVKVQNLPPPLFYTNKPFDWNGLWGLVFFGG